ncbi:MAG: hypothetical protein H6726_10900 [Sandaracinaceae bacterium]|nr:hypothetical protein [Myxococcales bacterium]MCB9658146.1 hypothetical protein [Sandaracinaceae bacterium]
MSDCTPGFFGTACTSAPYTAGAGDIFVGQSRCEGSGAGTLFVEEELVLNSGTFTTVGSAAYQGAIFEANCTRAQVVPIYPVAGRRYRIRMTKGSNSLGVRGSLLLVRSITSATSSPGNCIAHTDSGEPNWFLYAPTLTDTTDSVATTSASGFGGLDTQTRRLSDSAIMCTGTATCTFQANQGISYLIESEESRTRSNGQLCLQSAAPLLHVSMVGVEQRGRMLTWETSSETGTLGFIVEHDDGTGFAPVSELLPALSEPGGGVYAFHLPVGLTGALRVVELDVSGARATYELGGEAVSDDLSVSTAAPFASLPHTAPIVVRAKDADDEPGDVARVLVPSEGLVLVSSVALADALGVSLGAVTSAITTGELTISGAGAAVPYERHPGGVLFYADAPDHVFSDVRHYLVRLDGGGSAFATEDATPDGGAALDTYVRSIHLEQEVFAGMVVVEDPRSDLWFWQTVSPTAPLRTSFALAGAALDDASVTVEVQTIPGYDGGDVSLLVDGTLVGTRTPAGGREPLTFEVDAALLSAGTHAVEVRTNVGFLYVDQLDIAVPSAFGGEAGAFDASADGVVTVPEDEGLRVLDVSTPSAPRILEGLAVEAGTVSFRVMAGRRYWIDRGETLSPRSVRGAHPTDISGDLAAEYVVITHRSLLNAIAPLVDARAADGLSTVVVDVQDIFDTHSDGVPDPEAIRTFLTRARREWSVPPRYVLLAGHGTYDFRDLRGFGDNLVPSPITRTVGGLFATDGYLVSDSLTSGPAIPVGRLPASSAAELSQMVERILAYEQRAHETLLTVADRPSMGDDFVTAAAAASAQAPTHFTLAAVAQSGAVADARTELHAALAESPDAVFYFGHGGLDRIGRDGILRSQDLPGLDPSGLPALHFTMSCSVGRFDVPGFQSIAEELVRLPQGAVAVFGPSGQTTLADADALAGPVVATLYADNARLGDATLAATRSLGGQYDAARLFNLLGDPAMRTGRVVAPEPPSTGGGSDVFIPIRCSASVTSHGGPAALVGAWVLGLALAVRRRSRRAVSGGCGSSRPDARGPSR